MSNDSDKLALYFSHSWRPRDVDLNLRVWQQIADACELLVDVPDETGPDPPYHINRIEELLRQSDLFLCVLTERDTEAGDGQGDGALLCSPYSLFEIRLAERFDIPRLILYERGTRLKSPRSPRPRETYIAFNRGAREDLPDERYWRVSVLPHIQQWLSWVQEHCQPGSAAPCSLAVSLLPPDAPDAGAVGEQLEQALRAAGYERVALHLAHRNNIELFQILRVAGLVVMELGLEDSITNQLNAVAHALCIPAIRTMRAGHTLPWLFQGHPGGYSQDIVTWEDPAELGALVESRASAMFRISHALSGDQAHRYLESKRYSQDHVFISHTLKPPHRRLVERIFELLGQRYVNPFEYHLVNAAGTDWKSELDVQLRKATHFVVLLTDSYEQSQVCTYELEEILKRRHEVGILPFMAAGRSVPHPKLGELHHRLLGGKDVDADAAEVVEQVMKMLSGSAAG